MYSIGLLVCALILPSDVTLGGVYDVEEQMT